MKVNRIKQLFTEFAKGLPQISEMGPPEGSGTQLLTESLLIRGSFVLYGEYANRYFQLLEAVCESALPDGTWSRASIDDALCEAASQVAASPTEQRQQELRNAADNLVKRFTSPLTRWQVSLEVAGTTPDCNDFRFGVMTLSQETIRLQSRVLSQQLQGEVFDVLFACVNVDAIDGRSAEMAAAALVDQHLAVLNCLCSDWQPSRIHLRRGRPTSFHSFEIRRVKDLDAEGPLTQINSRLVNTPLTKADLDQFLKSRGGTRLQELLLTKDSFAKRVISGYVAAGTACVEPQPQLAFVFFMTALECAVLGRHTKTEIGYQLRTRVAHLMSSSPTDRKQISEELGDLYRLRSAIVHSGEISVSETELEKVRYICLNSLIRLATGPEFVNMKDDEEVNQWFEDRMLGAN